MKQTHKRLEKLRSIMRNAGLDIVALIPGATIRYLTGGVHYVMERPIVLFVPLDEQPVAVIPQLEVPLFKAKQIDLRIVSWTDAEGYDLAFQAGLDMLQPGGQDHRRRGHADALLRGRGNPPLGRGGNRSSSRCAAGAAANE